MRFRTVGSSLAAAALAGVAAADLIGDMYRADVLVAGAPIATQFATAIDGPDVPGTWFGSLAYDVEADSVRIYSLIDVEYVNGIQVDLSDLDSSLGAITSATVGHAAGAGFIEIDDADITFDDTSVSLDLAKIAGLAPAGAFVRVDLTFAAADGFIGDGYQADVLVDGAVLASQTSTAVVGPDDPGTWFTSLSHDVELDTVRIYNINPFNYTDAISAEILDLDSSLGPIIGATVVDQSGSGFDAIDASDLAFTANSVTIDLAKIADSLVGQIPPGAFVTVRTQHAPAPCPSDFDANGATDFADLLALLSVWGVCDGCPEDLDASGAVDFPDLLALLSAFGPC